VRLQASLHLALYLAISACSDLPDLELGVCGNRVLDPKEACDGFAPEGTKCGAPDGPNACRFVCGEEGAGCPEGHGCGIDLRCRRPTGQLGLETSERFPMRSLRVADLDGDRFADLVGLTPSQVSVRFGARGDPLSESRALVLPSTRGAIVVSDLDRNGTSDIVAPIDDGLFVLAGTQERELSPVPHPLVERSGASVVAIPLRLAGGVLASSALMFADGDALRLAGRQINLAGVKSADLGRPAVFALGGGPEYAALVYRGHNEAFIVTATVSGGALAPLVVQRLRVPAGVSEVRFVDVDADGAKDLLFESPSPDGPSSFAVSHANPQSRPYFGESCTWVPALIPEIPRRIDGVLEAGDVNGDGLLDLVSRTSILLGTSRPAVRCTDSVFIPSVFDDDGWDEAVIGDYNGDGRSDVAVRPKIADAVDILLRSPRGGFNRRRAIASARPVMMRAGDFDGDTIDDVAFVGRQGTEPDMLTVWYGSHDGPPSDPIVMGRFGTITTFEPHDLSFELFALDAMTDLLIVSNAGTDGYAVSVARGNPSRTLFSPLTIGVSAQSRPDQPHGLAIGEICAACNGEPGCVEQRDALVLARGEQGERMWLVPGDPTGGGRFSTTLAEETALPSGVTSPCDPISLSLDADGDGLEEILFAEHSTSCAKTEAAIMVAHTTLGGGSCLSRLQLDRLVLPERTVAVRDMTLHDIDLDGDLDLLIVYEDADRSTAAAIARSESGAFAEIEPLPRNGELFPQSISAMRGADSRPQIVLLMGAQPHGGPVGIYRLEPGLARGALPSFVPDPIEEATIGRHLRAADFDGDGLDDLAWIDGESLHLRFGLEVEP
jgi:hypothetical protein